MRVFIQLAICISLIILTGGTITFVHDATLGGGLILICAWGAMIAIAVPILLASMGLESDENEPTQSSSKRVEELSKQLTDIQDIVISLDDEIKRVNQKPNVEPLEKI